MESNSAKDDTHTGPTNQPTSKSRVLKPNRSTAAARWNTKVLRGLEVALRKDPEVDLVSLLSPQMYSAKLESFKQSGACTHADYNDLGCSDQTQPAHSAPVTLSDVRSVSGNGSREIPLLSSHDIRSRLCHTDTCTVLSKLSPDLQALLGDYEMLSEEVIGLLDESAVLYKSAWAASSVAFRVNDGIAAKMTMEQHIATEYPTLEYLKQHLPNFPTPKLHGTVRIGRYGILFSTFIPGLDLGKAWPQLDESEKRSLSSQLDGLMGHLRLLPFPAGIPLGGVHGQGCKDGRRGIRMTSEPIFNVAQFEDFMFSGSKTASNMYTRFLRSLMPPSPTKVVFTHGDLRPANVMVNKDGQGR